MTCLVAAGACGPKHAATSMPDDSTEAGPDSAGRIAGDSAAPLIDSTSVAAVTPPPAPPAGPAPSGPALAPTQKAASVVLPPLADTIAQYLVFDPIGQTWFLSAKRGKRLLVDIGRVDLDVQRDKRRRAAYLQAVKALSPLPIGTPIRIHDAWGVEDDTVAGFASWNDRIVATLHSSRHLDSLVRHTATVYATAERLDTAAAPGDSTRRDSARQDSARRGDSARRTLPDGRARPSPTAVDGGSRDLSHTARDSAARRDSASTRDTCNRDSLSPALVLRAAAVRDSIDLWLRTLPPPPYERLVNTERSQSTQVSGCFGGGNRLAVAVDLRAGANEWIRERTVLIDTLGRVTSLRTYDYRFKGHDLLAAFDPDGQGVDGIVARGFTQAAGGLVVLSLQPGNRLTRWVSGFSWEAR